MWSTMNALVHMHSFTPIPKPCYSTIHIATLTMICNGIFILLKSAAGLMVYRFLVYTEIVMILPYLIEL